MKTQKRLNISLILIQHTVSMMSTCANVLYRGNSFENNVRRVAYILPYHMFEYASMMSLTDNA